ncbi:hypothetical protein M885DRAFT_519434 [Pelagophyceae sp. CCMP2097]|nr:hypothetical protein M885DRAFT_519434 [Pelagophyceae sp. CCMP2097]
MLSRMRCGVARCAPRGARLQATRASSAPGAARLFRAVGGAGLGLGAGLALYSNQTVVADLLLVEPAVCDAAPVMTQEATVSLMDELAESRSRTWASMWREIVAHWLSFGMLTLATFVSTIVDRVALSGQVQQLMQLPGQMPLDALLAQIGLVFGIKAVQLIAEVIRAAVATRLGEKIEKKVRAKYVKLMLDDKRALAAAPTLTPDELKQGCRDASAATRVVVVEAAPKAIVEVIYGGMSALGAVVASPALATYFVAHEGLLSQLVGLAASLLVQRRDRYGAEAETARDEWERAAFQPSAFDLDASALEAKSATMAGACVAFGDAHAVVDRTMDAAQLAVLSSYVVSVAALVDKNVLGADASKYQRVMGLASGAMQAAGETSQSVEKFARAAEILMPVHTLEALLENQRLLEAAPPAAAA